MLALWLVATTAAALAHPLGNFTINHLSEVTVRSGSVDVRYVLDMAEIPTYSEMRERSPSGKLDAGGIAAWGHDRAVSLLPQLALSVDGVPAALHVVSTAASTRPGAGGLPTFYLVATYAAALTPGAHHLSYSDGTYADRLGWKDALVRPQTEPTHELTAYPNNLLGSPPDRTAVLADLSATGRVTAQVLASTQTAAAANPAPSAVRSNLLSDLLAKGTGDWKLVAFTLMVAVFLGALHALEPGHGKTLLAVSLVGARATVSQAAILAGALTVAHTIGVVGLGIAIETFKGAFVPDRIYPWITLISGIAIAVIGARSIQRQVVSMRPLEHAHGHDHDGTHAHAHPHVHTLSEHHHATVAEALSSDEELARKAFASHDALHAAGSAHDHGDGERHGHDHATMTDDEHARAHQIPGSAPLRFGPTVWAAMSGGIAPCPAALVVLLAAVALDKVVFGVIVVIAFSFGLAGTLTGLGIAVVRGAAFLQRRRGFERFVKYGPLVSAVAIGTIGAVMVGQGFVEQGVRVSSLLISLVTAIAIAGFAFSHQPARRAVNA